MVRPILRAVKPLTPGPFPLRQGRGGSFVCAVVALAIGSAALSWGPLTVEAQTPQRPVAGAPLSKPIQSPQPTQEGARPATSRPNETGQATPANPPPAPPLPGEVGPELYLLRDQQGRLQAVPGFSFEDFIELYRFKNQLASVDEWPRYVLSQSLMTGSLRGDAVALSLVLTIDLNDASWVRIPLGLTNSIVEGDATFDGPGDVLVEYVDSPNMDHGKADGRPTADRSGYVLWLRGEPRKGHKVSIPLITPVSLVGGETQLKLEAPRASVAQLVVDVPSAGVVGRVSDGATLLEPDVSPTKTTTTFSVLGASGPVELAWRPAGNNLKIAPSVLEASGAIWARVDGHSVGYEAKLSVRSFGGQFDSFRVRLPMGAQMIANSQPGLSIVPAPGPPGEAATSGSEVEVKLDKKTTGPFELRLLADRPRAADNPDESVELAGFEVLGAARQSGAIGVQLVGNWHIVWGESRGVRQLDEIPESIKRDDLIAAFEYSSQPCSLAAKVVPRRTRVSVQPRYILTVGAREARLAVDLKYTIRGAKVRALTIAMPGWEIDAIGPPNVVNVDVAAIEDTAQFSIPLAQPSNGDLSLAITARRAIPLGAKPEASQTLEFEFPRPIAEVVAPAIVAIQPEDNVELTPRSEALVGLGLRSTRPAIALPVLQQDPFFYQTEGTSSKLVADFKVHAQAIVVAVDSRIDLDEQEVRVEERLRYDISFEPVERLMLRVPRAFIPEKLEVTMDGIRLALVPVRDESDTDNRDSMRMLAVLGGSRIGRCELVVSIRLPQEKLPAATSVSLNVPLVMPADARTTQNRLVVRPEPGISVTARKGRWTIDDRGRGAGTSSEALWFTAGEVVDSVDLGVTLQDRSREASTVIERAWIQTWLSDYGRQDQAAFQLTTTDRRLRIGLPSGVNAASVQATLDGKTVFLEVDSQGSMVVALPASGVEQRRLLELNYHIAAREPAGAMSLEPPVLLPAVWSRRTVWQLIVPGHEHLLISPANFTSESQWKWTGRYWQRTPALDEQDLRAWVGLPAAPASPPTGVHCYVFSGMGETPRLEFRTARRATLVFSASLVVLVLGLGLMYLPALRHPALLLAGALGILSLGVVAPDLAMLVAQSAVLGTALVGIALLLARLSAPAAREVQKDASELTTGPTEQAATDLYQHVPSAGLPASTATAPMMIPATGAETAT